MNTQTQYVPALRSTTLLFLVSLTSFIGAMEPNSALIPQKTKSILENVLTLLEKDGNNISQSNYSRTIILIGTITQLLKINAELDSIQQQKHSPAPFEIHTRQLQYCRELIEKSIPFEDSPTAFARSLVESSINNLLALNQKLHESALSKAAALAQASTLKAKL